MRRLKNRTVPIVLIGMLLMWPASLYAAATAITVTGTTDDNTATITINGIAAVVADNTFTAQNVPLEIGPNLITATATDPHGNSASVSVTVIVATAHLIQGTIDDPTATVSVNGVAATVSGGQFSASVPLQLGLNTVTATAVDTEGNTSTHHIDIFIVRPPVAHP